LAEKVQIVKHFKRKISSLHLQKGISENEISPDKSISRDLEDEIFGYNQIGFAEHSSVI
jgi:hypothetical protein